MNNKYYLFKEYFFPYYSFIEYLFLYLQKIQDSRYDSKDIQGCTKFRRS